LKDHIEEKDTVMPTPLYIPEIGDRITLAEDWTFPLYREHRNDALWAILSGNADPAIVALERRKTALVEELEAIRRRGAEEATGTLVKMAFETQLIVRDEDRSRDRELRAELMEVNMTEASIAVTLPAGTVLAIDRIYIRKGISDYSSLSFNLTATLDPLISAARGRKRFWAKLADCNRIVMETPEPAAVLDGPGL
jgi:hypothetical protein